jgi:hypothetical protein
MSKETPVTRRRTAIALVLVALLSSGCSRAIGGTPMATPGQAGLSAGAAALDTTCGQYVTMSKADRRAVIVAIGEDGNRLVALNPDAWVDLAAALCTFVKPGATVRDVLKGAAR